MEGVLIVSGWFFALIALIIALVALAMLLRARRLSPTDPLGGARQAELERRFGQLGQRLEVVEQDIDARRSPEPTAGGEGISAARHRGTGGAQIGLVRFDAFADVGGGQSFALALIDDDGDGVVLSSLHTRQASRLYVKDVRGGIADAPLSGEEERALRQAGVDV